MTAPSPLTKARRIVVKTGSALVTNPDGTARQDWLNSFAADIAERRKTGQQLVLVASGAVALGRSGLGTQTLTTLDEKQAAAAIGQPRLMQALTQAFAPHGIHIAQALLTPGDTEHRRRWLNARATLETLLEAGTLPVINENDTVATEELRYGDNDRLAARVAQMISADVLVLLSDVDGIYTGDPGKMMGARHIPEIKALTPDILAMAGGANEATAIGSGGMVTKLAAARIAQAAGCATAITLGDRTAPLSDLATGAKASWVLPNVTPENARRSWIMGNLKPEGTLVIDQGAAEALRGGASLLPVGVASVTGTFERGAAIALTATDGSKLGTGITAFSSTDIALIAGQQSEAVSKLLGENRRPAIVHRDDLVLLD